MKALTLSEVRIRLRGTGGYPGRRIVNRAVRLERRTVGSRQSPGSVIARACARECKGCLPTGCSSEEAVMKYALVRVLAEVPPGGVCAGIDWASADHAVCVVDLAGRVRDRFTAVHDRAGIAGLIARLRENKAGEVAIERGDGVLVDALLAAGLTAVVIGSRQVKNLRSRYGSSGAKDDRFDAFVLADTRRTDRARLRPLVPDSPATLALRAAVRARKDLVAHRVSACNQLRAHLAV